jgi:hypothetical protein
MSQEAPQKRCIRRGNVRLAGGFIRDRLGFVRQDRKQRHRLIRE